MRKSKPALVIVGLLAIVAISIFASATVAPGQSRAPRVAPSVTPQTPPRTINGEELQTLLKGDGTHPLLVNYWATWCGPCRDEFPDLVNIDTQFRPKGLNFVAISLDDLKDVNTEVPKFLREMRAGMPVYVLNMVDPEPAINAIDPTWGGALPATFLYNSKGQMIYKRLGRINTAELRAAIRKLIK